MQLFKNALYYVGEDMLNWPALRDEITLNSILGEFKFTPCHASATISFGWVPPIDAMGEDNLVRHVEGAFLISFQIEEKKIPASGLKYLLNQRVHEIQTRESRKLKAKERAAVKDEILQDLLPKVISNFTSISAFIIPSKNLIIINNTSAKKAELLLNKLRESMGSLKVTPITSGLNQSPTKIMTSWLRDGFPQGYEYDSSLDLDILSDAEGLSIKIKNDDPACPEIQAHLDKGYEVTKISLLSEDITVTIKSDMAVSGIKVSDALIETYQVEGDDDILATLDSSILINKNALITLHDLMIAQFG